MGRRSEKSTLRRKEIGARLRYIRERCDMSLQSVAKLLDPPPAYQTVQKWETGAREIPIGRIEELAKIYGVNPADLLNY